MVAAVTEFEQDGAKYRIKKLDAIAQWHLNRKIAPLVPPLIPVFMKIARAGGVKGDIEGISGLLGPFADGIASMSDEASEYVINTCLSAIQREVSANVWMPIWAPGARISSFAELNDLSKVIPLVVKVIWDALGPFIQGLLTAQESKTAETTPTE